MFRPLPRFTRIDTLFPCVTRFRSFLLGLLRSVRRPDSVPQAPQHLPYRFPVIGIAREPFMGGEQPRHAVLEHREIDGGLVVAGVAAPMFLDNPVHPDRHHVVERSVSHQLSPDSSNYSV